MGHRAHRGCLAQILGLDGYVQRRFFHHGIPVHGAGDAFGTNDHLPES